MSPELHPKSIYDADPLVIDRLGETFHRKLGIGLYDGNSKNGPWREEQLIVWLPEETDRVFQRLQGGESLLVQGSAGDGKSAIVYGLRSRCRCEGQPYLYLDGHFLTTPAEEINRAIDWAQSAGAWLIFDSADYLTARPRKIRKLPLEAHIQRSEEIFARITDFQEKGGVVVATSHDEDWFEALGDSKLVDKLLAVFQGHIHQVEGVFETQEQLYAFYLKSGLDEKEADYLAGLPENPRFQDFIAKLTGDKRYLREVTSLLRTYRIAKILVIDPRGDNIEIRKQLSQVIAGEMEETRFWFNLMYFCLAEDKETIFFPYLR